MEFTDRLDNHRNTLLLENTGNGNFTEYRALKDCGQSDVKAERSQIKSCHIHERELGEGCFFVLLQAACDLVTSLSVPVDIKHKSEDRKLNVLAVQLVVFLTHCYGDVSPVEGTLLGADALLVQHHGQIVLTDGHLPISQWGNQRLQLFPSGEELLDGAPTVHLVDRRRCATRSEQTEITFCRKYFPVKSLYITNFNNQEPELTTLFTKESNTASMCV